MRIMDIDMCRNETIISIKDFNIGKFMEIIIMHDTKSLNEVCDAIYQICVEKNVYELHIETNGFGIFASDYFKKFDEFMVKEFSYMNLK